MANEMARELMGLDKYTAYAKILQEQKGSWKGRIGTFEIKDQSRYRQKKRR